MKIKLTTRLLRYLDYYLVLIGTGVVFFWGMFILTNSEFNNLLSNSKLTKKYNVEIDRESAYEILNKKIELAESEEAKEKAKKEYEDFPTRAVHPPPASLDSNIIYNHSAGRINAERSFSHLALFSGGSC